MADSRDIIRRQARRAAEADYHNNTKTPCRYTNDEFAGIWHVAYKARKDEMIRACARADVEAGKPITDCRYERGSPEAKRYVAEYLIRECELEQERERVDEVKATRL